MPLNKLTQDFLDNLESSTIERSLSKRMSDSLFDISEQTSFEAPLTKYPRMSSYADVMKSIGGIEEKEERSMLEGIGRALWMGGTHFAETATFGLGKLAGIKAPEAETTGEKVGAAIGGAAGFLIPFGVGKAAVSAIGRGFAGKYSSKRIANSIQGGVREILNKKGQVKLTSQLPEKIDDVAALFEKTVTKPVLIKRVKGFESGFKKATERQAFSDQVKNEAGKMLDDAARLRGFELKPNAIDDITKLVSKEWANAGGRPISDIQGLIAKKLGDGKAANFYGHLFEEGLIFAGVENVMHGIDVAAGETQADFAGTTAHAFILGHVLGGVRFIPGGIRGGTVGFMNKPGRERLGALLSKSNAYAKSYDTSVKASQDAIFHQYTVFAKMRENILGGSAISERLKDSAMKGRFAGKLKGLNGKITHDYSYSNLKNILKNGNAEQKKMAAEIMQDGLQYISSSARSIWKKDFLKVWGDDLVSSTPRMLIGGLAMGNMALFDENIPLEDKLITFATGAFLMKHGKELHYKGADGSYQMRESLRDFPDKVQGLKDIFDTIGGEPNSALWFKMMAKVSQENKYSNVGIANTSPSEVQKLTDIANHQHPESDRKMFIKDSDAPVKISKKKGQKPASDIESIYKDFTDLNSKEGIIKDNEVFKEWEELHPKEKMKFKELLEEADIWDGMDVYDTYVEANTSRMEAIQNGLVQTAHEASSEIKGSNNIPFGVATVGKRANGDSFYKFKPITVRDVDLTDGQMFAIHQYNALIELIAKKGIHVVDSGNPVNLSRNSEGIKLFADRVERGIDELNEGLGLTGIERKTVFTDGWLKDGFDLLNLRTSIKRAAELLPKIFDDKSESNLQGQLMRKIFYDDVLNIIPNKLKTRGEKEQNFLNAMLPSIKMMDQSRDNRLEGQTKTEKTVDSKLVRELMQSLENEGITEFNNYDGRKRNMFSKQVKHHILRNKLRTTVISDGKGGIRRLDSTDIGIVQRLIDTGIQNQSLTIKPIQQILFDIDQMNVFESMDGVSESAFIRALGGDKSPQFISSAKMLFQEINKVKGKNDIKTFGAAYVKDLNAIIEPYMMKTIDVDGRPTKVGFLRESTEEMVNISLGKIATLVTELQWIKTGQLPIEARRMLKSMDEELMSTESINNRMIVTLLSELGYNGGDQIKVYSLAVEHGLWNPKSKEWNRDLSETRLQQVLENVVKSSKRDWGMETAAIEELLKSKQDSDTKSGAQEFRTQTVSHLINEFSLDGEFADKKDTGFTHSEQLQQLFYTKYEGGENNGLRNFLGDLGENILKNNPKVSIDAIVGRISKIGIDNLSSRRIRTIRFNQENAKGSTWGDGVVKESEAMRLISESMADMEGVIDNGKIVIIESEGRGRGGKLSNLSEPLYYDSVVESMFRGKYSAHHESFGMGDVFQTTKMLSGNRRIEGGEAQYIVYRVGNSEWAYGIDKSSLQDIGKNYFNHIKNLQEDGVITKAEFDGAVNENRIKVDKDTGEFESMTVPESAKIATQQVHKIMNDLVLGKIIGGIKWWGDDVRNSSGADMANLAKRAGLFNNISANSLTSDAVRQISEYVSTTDAKFADKKIVIKKLKQFSEGKVSEVVVRDEMSGDKISHVFSIRDEQVRQYDEAIGKTKDVALIKSLELAKAKLESIKDASDVNSVTIVEPDMFKAMSFLFGATESNEIGGIKPIILGTDGRGNFFIEKTAYVKNSKMQSVFDANEGVGFITFTSASKQIGGKYSEGYNILEIKDLKELNQEIGADFRRAILPENVKLLHIKGDKASATLPPNHTTHFTDSSSLNSFFNYYVESKISSSEKSLKEFTNVDNAHSILAEFKSEIRKSSSNLKDSDIDVGSSQLGVQEMWAEMNGLPFIFKRQWENLLKKKYIDDIIRLKIAGGQGVLAPDIGVGIEGGASSRAFAERIARGETLKTPKDIQFYDNNKKEIEQILQSFKGGQTTFETAKGSSYTVQSDGTTVRDKALRPEHPGDMGIKEQSSKTLYLSMHSATQLFSTLGKIKTVIYDKATDREISGMETMQVGRLGVTIHGKTYGGMSSKPKKGLLPFEVWLDSSGKVVSYHIGNKITKIGVSKPTKISKPTAPSRLKHTLLGNDGETFQVGEIEIGHNNRFKEIDPYAVRFVERSETGNDKLVSPKISDIKHIRNLEDLHNYALSQNRQVVVISERNPHTKPDSVLVLGLKGFTKEGDGNIAIINAGDVKRALEGDYDIDTVNFWWNAPNDVVKQYMDGRGTVTDSQVIGVGSNPSYGKLNINSASDMTEYSNNLKNSDYLKGSIMNAQRVVQWLSHHDSPSFARQDGAIFKIGKNRYATIKSDKKSTHQLIADMNQAVLDAKNGYDLTRFKDFDSVMDEILFGERGLFDISFFSDRGGKDKLGAYKVIEGAAGRVSSSEKAIIRELIRPYRDLMSLANKIYEGGEGKKVGFQQLITGAKEFDNAMLYAERNALKTMDKAEREAFQKELGKDNIFGGFNFNARLFSSEKTNKLRSEQNMLPYDRLLARIVHIGELSMSASRTRFDKTVPYADEIRMLTETENFTEAYRNFSDQVRDSVVKGEVSNRINENIQQLYKLKNSYSNPKTIEYYNKRIEKLQFTRDSLNKEIARELGSLERYEPIRKAIVEEYVQKILRENKAKKIEMSISDVKKKALKEFKNNGILVQSTRDGDIIAALAANEAFGNFGYRNEQELGLEGTEFKEMSIEVSNIKKDFSKAWGQWNRKDGTWINENHIYEHFLQRIDNISQEFAGGSLQMRNVMLARLMTPEISLAKFTSFRGALFPSPKYENFGTFINLGMRWNKTRNPKAVAEQLTGIMASAYSKAHIRLVGGDTTMYDGNARRPLGEADITGSFYLSPFEYSQGHSRDLFLGQVAGNARVLTGKYWSRLDEYERLHTVFGSGLLRDIINNEKMLQLPHSAVTAYSKYGRDFALEGFNSMQRAIDMEADIFISSREGESVIGHVGADYINEANFNRGGRNAKNAREWTEEQVKAAKELCI